MIAWKRHCNQNFRKRFTYNFQIGLTIPAAGIENHFMTPAGAGVVEVQHTFSCMVDISKPPSEYERLRQANIVRNEQFLAKIGISPKSTQVLSSPRPRPSTKRKLPIQDETSVPLRRSTRTQIVRTTPSSPGSTVKDPIVERSDLSELGLGIVKLATKGPGIESISVQRSKSGSSPRCQDIDADISSFLGQLSSTNINCGLCKPLEEYGKAAVMEKANQGVLPRFSKYCGAVEWRNCVFLWVNAGPQGDYPNTFSEGGRYMMWFGGSRMHADSPVVQRLLRARSSDLSTGTSSDSSGNSQQEELVLLFVRLPGEGYSCLGKVKWAAVDTQSHPVKFKWELVDLPAFADSPQFRRILQESKAS